jgi:RsiW-degrading membrane proteinase PrsW (M82 family)
VPAVLVVVAVLEELAKSAPVLAGFEHVRYPRTPRWAVAAGVASGVGFFLGEKLALLAQVVGLGDLAVATAALGPDPTTVGPLAALGLLLAPLALHAGTTACSSVGATRGRRGWLVGLTVAVAVHLAYNAAVLAGVGA